MIHVVCMSDSHGLHDQISVPAGDVLVHSGDSTNRGEIAEVIKFLQWYSSLPHKNKVLIAGNHDFIFEKNFKMADELLRKHAPGVIYLNDSGATIAGLKFWGSPVQPEFYNWAFNRRRGAEIQLHWDMIPTDTQVLVTHGPPMGVLDSVVGGGGAGCANLRQTLKRLPNLKLHIFGHLHSDGGQQKKEGNTIFVNAAICDEDYRPIRMPFVATLIVESEA